MLEVTSPHKVARKLDRIASRTNELASGPLDASGVDAARSLLREAVLYAAPYETLRRIEEMLGIGRPRAGSVISGGRAAIGFHFSGPRSGTR